MGVNIRVKIKRDRKTYELLKKRVKTVSSCDELWNVFGGAEWLHGIDNGEEILIRDSWMPRITLPYSAVEVE